VGSVSSETVRRSGFPPAVSVAQARSPAFSAWRYRLLESPREREGSKRGLSSLPLGHYSQCCVM
jgi:hypothetical protein